MMKKIFIILICSVLANAISSYEIASKLVNDSSKDGKLRLLFPDGSYTQNGVVDVKAITQVLKMNSLIKYSYSDAKDTQIKFSANAKVGIFLKSITKVFEQIGINYYLVSEYTKNNDEISVSFDINSKFVIDPGLLYDAFSKMGIYIVDANKESNNFAYVLDFSKAKIAADFNLNSGDELELTKPLDAYFIKTNSISKISIDIGLNSLWYPKIEFLDKNLNLIKTYSSDNNTKNITLELPKFCEYILVSDKYTLEHIKLGIKIGAR